MKFHLLFLSIILPHYLFSQVADNKFSIFITATTSVSGDEFSINIYKRERSIKIVYSLRDSVNHKSLDENKYYNEYRDTVLKLLNNLKENKEVVTLYLAKIDSLIKQYSYYSKDSIVLKTKKNPSYNNLLKKVFLTSAEKLENREGNKHRIVLDGTTFKFHLLSSVDNRIILAHSPREKSHPLVYQLISETLEAYRQAKNNLFLDKRKTSGY